MIGYVVTDNGRYGHLNYKVGRTFTLKGELSEKGKFHFYNTLVCPFWIRPFWKSDILDDYRIHYPQPEIYKLIGHESSYKSLSSDNLYDMNHLRQSHVQIFEMERLGETFRDEVISGIFRSNRLVPKFDKIRVNRLVPKSEYGDLFGIEYDKDSKLIIKGPHCSGYARYEYNDKNRVARRINENGKTVFFVYDSRGNLTQEVCHGRGDEYHYEYDERDRLISCFTTWGREKYVKYTCEYGRKDNLIKMVDKNGRGYRYRYDDRNRLITQYLPDGGSIDYFYDDNNRLIKNIFDDKYFRFYEYDNNGHLIRSIKPNSYSSNYIYDEEGNRIEDITNQQSKYKIEIE